MRTIAAEHRRIAALAVLPALQLALALTGADPGALAAQEDVAKPRTERAIAVTVDDLPAVPSRDLAEMRRVTDGMLAVLARHGVQAVAFVNEAKLAPAPEREQRTALLESWLQAGHELGNHSYSHADLGRTPLAEYQEDVLRGEVVTRELLAARGRAPLWFRHPYTHTGPTRETRRAFEAFLAEHGYRVAPFSIENADYMFERLREKAAEQADAPAVARLRSAYVDYTLSVTEQMEALARDTFGRDVAQVLLIHANRLNVESLDAVLERLAARGYRFVSLAQALSDPAWQTPDEYVGARGPSWLFRFRIAKGLPLGLEREPDPPAWVLERFREVMGL